MDPIERLRKRLTIFKPAIPDTAFRELDACAQLLVPLYLQKSKPLPPTAAARELRAMAKGLDRAAAAADRLGEDGMLVLFSASNIFGLPNSFDPKPHIDYLVRLARWAERAAKLGKELAHSARDHGGGPHPDQNLRSLVVLLMDRFRGILGIKPTSRVSVDSSELTSPCDEFIKSAIAYYAPEGIKIEPEKIETAIRHARPSRDLEFFDPPRIPE